LSQTLERNLLPCAHGAALAPSAPRSVTLGDFRAASVVRVAIMQWTLVRLLDDGRIRYLLSGGSIALLYLALFAGISYGFPDLNYLIVLAIAQVVTICAAFPLYRRFVFASTGTVTGDLRRFLAVWMTSLVVVVVGLPFLVEVVGMSPVPAQALITVLVPIGSFLGHKHVSFRSRAR
jgi:putative flippase GtrA